MNGDISAEKKKFIEQEFMDSTIKAGLSTRVGGRVYKTGAEAKDREDFGKYLRKMLRDFYEKHYKDKQVEEEEHIENLRRFADVLSEKSDILEDGKIRFGVAQKLLNLYLKYLWSADIMKYEPPHCPVDSIISNKVEGHYTWTASDSEEKYREIVKLIKQKAEAKGWTIAVWELFTYSNAK